MRHVGLLAALGLTATAHGLNAAVGTYRPPLIAARLAPVAPLTPLAPRFHVGNNLCMQHAEPSGFMEGFKKFSDGFSNLFPVWTMGVATLGLVAPSVFAGISTSYFTGLLGLLMLSMGITLTVDDFKRVLARPTIMLLGFLACYGLMPAVALGLSRALGLPCEPASNAGRGRPLC